MGRIRGEIRCQVIDKLLLNSILLNIMFHAPMERFQLELIYYFTYFFTYY